MRDDVIVLCHGGLIATPENAGSIVARCADCDCFYRASSMERLPAEVALTERTRRFKAIRRELREDSSGSVLKAALAQAAAQHAPCLGMEQIELGVVDLKPHRAALVPKRSSTRTHEASS